MIRSCRLVIVVLLAACCLGLIDTQRTPATLVNEATWILQVRLKLAEDKTSLSVEPVVTLKGEAPVITRLLCDSLEDIAILMDDKDFLQFDVLMEALEGDGAEATIFRGNFAKSGIEGGKALGALHTKIFWFGLVEEGGAYRLVHDDIDLGSVWDGGNAPLARLVRTVVADPRTTIPTDAGTAWRAQPLTVAAGSGPVTALESFRLGNVPLLVALGPKGDRVFRVGDARIQDLTADWELTTASSLTVPFPLDGCPALVVWGPQSGSLIIPAGDTARTVPLRCNLTGVMGLDTIVMAGQPRLAVLHGQGLSLLNVDATGAAIRLDLPGAPAGPAAFLAIDLDGDGHGDLLVITKKGIHLAKGTVTGLAPFAKIGAPASLIDPTHLTPADFDGDGDLDVFMDGPKGLDFLVNPGNGTLVSLLHEAGELDYHTQLGSMAVCGRGAGDLNHDGRCDLLLISRDSFPGLFFNRGWRSFGFARRLNQDSNETMTAVMAPKTAGTLADIDGDGALDAVVATEDGSILALLRAGGTEAGGTLALQLALPATLPGPVTLRASARGRDLGAFHAAWGRPARIIPAHPGTVLLSWTDGNRKSRSHKSELLTTATTESLEP